MKGLRNIVLALGCSAMMAFVPGETWEVVNAAEVLPSELLALWQQKGEELVVQFAEGTVLPVQVNLTGDVATLSEAGCPRYLTVHQAVYVRVQDRELLFSSDLTEWRSISDYFSGCLSVLLEQDALGFNGLRVDMELNKRD